MRLFRKPKADEARGRRNVEMDFRLASLQDFQILKTQAPQLFDTQTQNDIKGQALKNGVASAFLDTSPASTSRSSAPEMREHFQAPVGVVLKLLFGPVLLQARHASLRDF